MNLGVAGGSDQSDSAEFSIVSFAKTLAFHWVCLRDSFGSELSLENYLVLGFSTKRNKWLSGVMSVQRALDLISFRKGKLYALHSFTSNDLLCLG